MMRSAGVRFAAYCTTSLVRGSLSVLQESPYYAWVATSFEVAWWSAKELARFEAHRLSPASQALPAWVTWRPEDEVL